MKFLGELDRAILIAAILISASLSLLCLHFMTLEYDEAWIIASARQAFLTDAIPQVTPVTTTGGPHFFLVGLAARLDVDPIFFARCVSLLSAAALLGMVYFHFRRQFSSSTERLIIIVTCLAAPGTIMLAGMGYAITLALTLFLAGLLILTRKGRATHLEAVLAGVLLGAAMATRWTLIPAIMALPLIAVGSKEDRRGNLIAAGISGVVAIAVLAGSILLQVSLLDGAGPNQDVSLAVNAGSAGATSGFPSPARLLSFVVRASATLPISLLVIACVAWLSLREHPVSRRWTLVFVGAAALILLAWAVRSPWMHLRYIWPAYLLISLGAGMGLAMLYRKALADNLPNLAVFAVALPVVLTLAQLLIGLRLVAVGAAMQLNAAGYDNLENHYKPFHLYAEEAAITRYLSETPPGTVFGTVGLPSEQGALELSLVGQRPIIDFKLVPKADKSPDFIIVHRFSPFNDRGQAWLESLGDPVARIKGYTIYPFPSGHVIPEASDITLDPELYRFSLVKWVSLTGW